MSLGNGKRGGYVGLAAALSLFAVTGWASGGEPAGNAKQALFERVFGDAARLDPQVVERVKRLPPGKRLLLDRDGDGRRDEAWFLDDSPRHTIRPILVRAIDEDGDLDRDGRPDRDSDLYLADWHADGTVDSVVDYQDDDGDGDLDAMGIFYWWPKNRYLEGDALWVWWGEDLGDRNLLWYDVNWTYSQPLCQYRCYFSGDTRFAGFGMAADSDHWIGCWENPFVFYDPDRDGAAEEVMRFSGLGDEVGSLRWSFDADGDAAGDRAYDYEFSITALAEGSRWIGGEAVPGPKVRLAEAITRPLTIRGIATDRVLRWEDARAFAPGARWAMVCLTWDEMNANTEGRVDRDPHERWEGVIAHGSEDFPQIGGPPCSALNKRNEIGTSPPRPLRLVFDRTDRRLHLLGATRGWLHVDFDLDGKVDAEYTYLDDDGDGRFDRRQIDMDADGMPEFTWAMDPAGTVDVKLEYRGLSQFCRRELGRVLDDSQRFIDAAKAALGDAAKPDPVEAFFVESLASWHPETGLGQRMRSTPGGARLYVDLLRDRLFCRLRQKYAEQNRWKEIEAKYSAGEYAAAADLVLARLAADALRLDCRRFGGFARRIPVTITNPGEMPLEGWPVAVRLESLAKAAGDFNADSIAVVAPERWIAWREVAHQVDRAGSDGAGELCFLADVPADGSATYYVYYSPAGKREKDFGKRTGAAVQGGNIAWESTRACYRSVGGQIDFLGRTQYVHSERRERLILPLEDEDGPSERDWGIDALAAGKTAGLGGMTVMVGDRVYPVFDPGGTGWPKITQRVLAGGPVRTTVEITATDISPELPDLAVVLRCTICAGRPECRIRATVSGTGEKILFAPGITPLKREQAIVDPSLGVVGAWGSQEDRIGEVGLGLIVPSKQLRRVEDQPDERRAVCTGADGSLEYWIVGDWRRGRRFPVAPTADNWRDELRTLARRLHTPPLVAVQPAEALDSR